METVCGQETCRSSVHVECARRDIKYDLTMESPLIFCRAHKAALRHATINLLNEVKQKEIERFTQTIQNCIEVDDYVSTIEHQAIMRLNLEEERELQRQQYEFEVPDTKCFDESDSRDVVGLLHIMLAKIDEVFGSVSELGGLWEMVYKQR